jgi:hypothetical protein
MIIVTIITMIPVVGMRHFQVRKIENYFSKLLVSSVCTYSTCMVWYGTVAGIVSK